MKYFFSKYFFSLYLTVKNYELVAIIRNISKNGLDIRVNCVYKHILEKHIGPVNSIVQEESKKKLKSSFFSKFNEKRKRLKRVSRTFERFEKAYHTWMNCLLTFITRSDETEHLSTSISKFQKYLEKKCIKNKSYPFFH